MIRLQGRKISKSDLELTESQIKIYEAIDQSIQYFNYNTLHELKFELFLRDSIIQTSFLLNDSNVVFAPFKLSRFNQDMWIHTEKGYLLKTTISPSIGIKDIFLNSQKYAFECSTAIIIIYYKAVLESIKEEYFNILFQNLFVWDWNYDKDLGIITQIGNDFIPGDVVYFFNPDYDNPVWMGENAVFLGNDLYFGHGIGVRSSEDMIKELNKLRKEGAEKSAFLLSQHSRLNYNFLSRFNLQ